jgi:hypothetical protein
MPLRVKAWLTAATALVCLLHVKQGSKRAWASGTAPGGRSRRPESISPLAF